MGRQEVALGDRFDERNNRGALGLPAWFRRFSFSEHKGWTVLIAVASVGVSPMG
ncbi:MAG: hypothetical protein ACLQLG_07225 [Thermoguttaceae bacterium]